MKKPKKYQPQFTQAEIEQLLDWYAGEFGGSFELHKKLLRIQRKFIALRKSVQG